VEAVEGRRTVVSAIKNDQPIIENTAEKQLRTQMPSIPFGK
jgi:hypothetical protein